MFLSDSRPEMNEVEHAIELMNRAWQARYEVIMSRPATQEQFIEEMEPIHRDLSEAVSILRNANADELLVQALGKLGHVEKDVDRYDFALETYQESVAISRDLGDELLLAHAVRHLGDIFCHLELNTEAESCYDESMDIYERSGGERRLDHANAARASALLKQRLRKLEEADKLWKLARDLYAQLDIQEGVDECSKYL